MHESRSDNSDPGRHWFLGLLEKHPALLVSGLYLVASTIGMMFSWAFLREFGINVFDYAQIGDFLLASLKEPFTWALFALAFLLVVLDNAMGRRFQRKKRAAWIGWYGSERYRRLNYFVAVILVVMFLTIYADVKAKDVYDGNGRVVEYQLADSESSRSATFLGTTAQVVFLFDVQSQRVYVHPYESLVSISFIAPRPQARD